MHHKIIASLVFLMAQLTLGMDGLIDSTSVCDSITFSFPKIFGAIPIDIKANEVHNYSTTSLLPGTDEVRSYTIDFCNVTISYSHIGWNDTINASIWIPKSGWNGRMIAVGGGGFSASLGPIYQTAPVAQGFVTIATDSGHEDGLVASTEPSRWMISGPGNLNLNLIEDWASRTLGELSTIGKHTVQDFFGKPPSYSYFTGCSGGGRQGLELAQTFPGAFDGILAAAPALYIETFLVAGYLPTLLMNQLNIYPPPCEIQGFTQGALDQCDRLDGLQDGIISHTSSCKFNPYGLVGKTFLCNDTHITLTEAGAKIVEAAWRGPHGDEASWPGLSFDADLSRGAVITQCNDTSASCSAIAGGGLFGTTLQNLILADPDYDLTTLTPDDFYPLLAFASRKYRQWIGASSPQLHQFQRAGGKLITWHGGADEVIPTRGSSYYYDEALERNKNVPDFFRHFEAPGVGHCSGGAGPMPNSALEQLMGWVENGTAPDRLHARSSVTGLERPLCPYPSHQVYIGGNASSAESFACVSGG